MKSYRFTIQVLRKVVILPPALFLFVASATGSRGEDLRRLEQISSDLPKGVSVMALTERSPKIFSKNPEVFEIGSDIATFLKIYSRGETAYPKISQGYFAMLKAVNELGLVGFRSSDSDTRSRVAAALKKSFEKGKIAFVRTIDVGDCVVLLWSKDDLVDTLDAIEKSVRKRLAKSA